MSGDKLRVYLRRGLTEDLRKLASFKLERTHDLYFSIAGQSFDCPPEGNPGGSAVWRINAPEDWQNLPHVEAKTSLHKSGLMHTTTYGGTGAGDLTDVFVGRPGEITEPLFLVLLITKLPDHFERESRSPTRGGAHPPMIIAIPEALWYTRLYIEFFISPSGEIQWPPPRLKTPPEFAAVPQGQATLSLELDRHILVRVIPTHPINQWKPEDGPTVSFCIFEGPGLPSVPTTEPDSNN